MSQQAQPPRALLGLLFTCSTLTVAGGAIVGPVANEIGAALSVGPSAAGLIITMHGAFVFMLGPLAGLLIDRVGAKRPFSFGLILYGLAGGSGLVIESYGMLLATRAFLGAAIALIFTGVTVVIINLYGGRERHRIMGYRASANSLGATFWPLIGGALGVLSWHAPFAVYLVGIPLGLLILAFMPEVRAGSRTDDISVRSIVRANPVLVAVYSAMFITMLMLYSNVVYMPRLLYEAGLSTTFQVGLFLAAMGLAAAVTASRYHVVRSRLEYHRIIPIAFLMWTGAYSIIFFTSSFWTYGLGLAMFGVGQGLMFPTALLWVGDIVPTTHLGRFASYLTTFGFLGQFLSPIVFAPLTSTLEVHRVFLATGIIAATGLVVSLLGLYLRGLRDAPSPDH